MVTDTQPAGNHDRRPQNIYRTAALFTGNSAERLSEQ